jgi:hypothetical protein
LKPSDHPNLVGLVLERLECHAEGDDRVVRLFTLSRRMGTSLAMIDATYGHLGPDAEEQERALLDAFDGAALAAVDER